MTAGLARGWAMARACAAVLKQHPKLALLPAASAAILLLVAALVLVSLLPQFGAWHAAAGAIWERVPIVWLYVLANGALFVLTVLVTTLNAALIHCALRCHAGQAPSLRAGLAASARALPQIAGWAGLSLLFRTRPETEGRAERREAHSFRCRAGEARRASGRTRSPRGAPPWQ